MAKMRFQSVYSLNIAFIFLVFSLHSTTSTVNPGLKLRVTQYGLNYAATQAINSLDLQGKTIPDIHGSDDVSVGKVDYDITGVSVTAFKKPASALSIQSSQGINWSVTGCNAELAGNWHYRYKVAFISYSDSGSFTVSVTNANVHLGFTLGADSQGRPTIRATSCASSVGDVDVKIHGGLSWLYKIFDHKIDDIFKDQMIKLLCEQANDAINVDANKALQKAKVVLPIRGTGILDYSMLMGPIFASGYLDSYHKGEIYYKDHKDAPYTPAAFPESFDRSKMVYIWMSDYLLNTAGWALQKQNILKYFYGPNDLNPDDKYLLNTTCPNNVCIGNFIAKLQDDFPDCTVSMNLSTSTAPTLIITPENIMGRFEGDLVFFINFPNKTTIYAFTAHARANFTLDLALEKQKVTANVTDFTPLITVTDSKIGEISGAGLTWTFKNVLARKFIIPQFNKIGAEGLDIPGTDQISYVNSTLKLLQNAIVLSTDVKWTPDFEREKNQHQPSDNVLKFRPRKSQGKKIKKNLFNQM